MIAPASALLLSSLRRQRWLLLSHGAVGMQPRVTWADPCPQTLPCTPPDVEYKLGYKLEKRNVGVYGCTWGYVRVFGGL